jgi:hypothetical protein
LPKSIVSLLARKFANTFFEKILNQIANFKNSEWEKEVEKNKEFYDWIDKISAENYEVLKNA